MSRLLPYVLSFLTVSMLHAEPSSEDVLRPVKPKIESESSTRIVDQRKAYKRIDDGLRSGCWIQ